MALALKLIFIKLLFLSGAFLFDPFNVYFLLILNTISAVVCFYLFFKRKSEWSVLSIFILDVFFPLIGIVIFVLFILLRSLYSLVFRSKYLEYDELPVGESHYENFVEDSDAKILIENRISIDNSMKDKFEERPYYEILHGDDKKVKISTIDILKDLKNRQAIGILQKFLDDDFYEVRYFANNTLESIEKSFYDYIESMNHQISKNSSSAELFVERGFAFLDLCESNILDKESQKFFYEKSLYDFIFALALDPQNERAYIKVVHIYLCLEDDENVIEMCDRVLKMDVSAKCKDKIRYYMMESYFNQRKLKKLYSLLDEVDHGNINFDNLNPSYSFWSQS
tara:strand:- start:109756 stop:110772 length:1017 start_codon:yes stop_codon:yes gene_type:complete